MPWSIYTHLSPPAAHFQGVFILYLFVPTVNLFFPFKYILISADDSKVYVNGIQVVQCLVASCICRWLVSIHFLGKLDLGILERNAIVQFQFFMQGPTAVSSHLFSMIQVCANGTEWFVVGSNWLVPRLGSWGNDMGICERNREVQSSPTKWETTNIHHCTIPGLKMIITWILQIHPLHHKVGR